MLLKAFLKQHVRTEVAIAYFREDLRVTSYIEVLGSDSLAYFI